MGLMRGLGKAAGAAGTVVTAIEAGNRAWEAANKDGRLSAALVQMKDRTVAAAKRPDPVERFTAQLDAVQTAIDQLQAAPALAADRPSSETFEEWERKVALLRTKVAPLGAMTPSSRRQPVKDLQRRVDALLKEILNYGLPQPEVKQKPRRAIGRGKKKS